MSIDDIKARIEELKEMAKQHEAILLQISGAIQEYTRVIEQAEHQTSDQ